MMFFVLLQLIFVSVLLLLVPPRVQGAFYIQVYRGYNTCKIPSQLRLLMAKLKREEVEGALLQETHLSNSEHGKLTRWRFNLYLYALGSKRGMAILIST